MGDDPCSSASEDLKGIERDVFIATQVEQLRIDFFEAIAAGEDQLAREHVDRFEERLKRLPPGLRHEVISETTVMLGDELKAQREARRKADED